jgi:hypothetical protein
VISSCFSFPFDLFKIICDIQTDGYWAYLCRNLEVTSGANISGVVIRDESEDVFPARMTKIF